MFLTSRVPAGWVISMLDGLNLKRDEDGDLGCRLHRRPAVRHELQDTGVHVGGEVQVVPAHVDLLQVPPDPEWPLRLLVLGQVPADLGHIIEEGKLPLEVVFVGRGQAGQHLVLHDVDQVPQPGVLWWLPSAAFHFWVQGLGRRPLFTLQVPDKPVAEDVGAGRRRLEVLLQVPRLVVAQALHELRQVERHVLRLACVQAAQRVRPCFSVGGLGAREQEERGDEVRACPGGEVLQQVAGVRRRHAVLGQQLGGGRERLHRRRVCVLDDQACALALHLRDGGEALHEGQCQLRVHVPGRGGELGPHSRGVTLAGGQ
mmetsp:Transcript_41856/g.104992  ORF Transcript_41856/g.104992 Transcript_41856/m.104992 type:complete len:315 (+) Transcript_41856:612-1556(+)